MEVLLREIDTPEEARGLAPRLDRLAEDALREYRDDPLPPGVGARLLERAFGAPESVLLVAESAQGRADLGLCVVGPLEDPLSGERMPMILLLHVEPDVRHRGLARALVDEARSILAERGIGRLAARAAHNDDALISMGERWGFTRQWELLVYE